MNTVDDNVKIVMEELRSHANAASLEGMSRFGINTVTAYGISIPTLRTLAKTIGRDHELALALWKTGQHDARLLCAFMDDNALVTPQQMDDWASGFDSWDVTDQVCNHLFSRTEHAVEKVTLWSRREEEFVRRAAFALMASLAVHAKTLDDAQFLSWLSLIEEASGDERNYVKKAVNWALRQIGKRSAALYQPALQMAEQLSGSDVRSARWIGRDAVRELMNPRTIERVQKK